MTDEPKILAGRYEVGDLIGRGGMAEVHIGYDTRLGRTVAIKILRADLARDPSFQTRFRREAQSAAGLNHPAIVAVYDTGEESLTTESGQIQTVPFIVMEYVEGHTVRDILKGDVAAPIDEAVEITSGVLAALEYAHHAGLVHRDIKPANVMLTPTGAVKVMDFGIARALADAGQTMTQTQAVVGTAQYLSPEQARGENVDARSDLYSAGCLLFELLTGRPPFTGDSPVSVAYQHVREEAPLPSTFASDVPPELDRVVAKALKKNRDDRYSTAHEFLLDLRAAIGEPMTPAAGVAPGGAMGAAAFGAVGGAAAASAMGDTGQGPATGATAVMPAAGPGGWATVVGGPPPTVPGAAPVPVSAHVTTQDQELVYDNPRRRRLIQIGILVGSILAAALLIWALFQITKPGDDTPEVTNPIIPRVENLTEQEAFDKLDELGLEVVVEEQPSTDVERGRAIGTDPEEGTEVEPGSLVTLFISIGPEDVEIPSVRGLLQADAVEKLEAAGLRVTQIESAHDPDIENGRATGTNPEEGTIAQPEDEIILYVSDGQVELPDLRKQQESQARLTLVDLGLIPNVVSVETSDFPAGEVINQDPLPGLVPQRSTVTLQVAKAPTTVQVPNVVGKTEAEARQLLQDAGLAVSTSSQSSLTVDAGKVISQNPSAGITVAKGTTVAIVISTGIPTPGP
jgi:beta-lactam-binding protein with PASTA domain